MSKLSGKSILITGGGSGIGQAASLCAAREGASVTVADFNEAGAQETVDAILKAGGKAQAVKVDVALEGDAQKMVEQAVAAYGGLDGAANCAGVSQSYKLLHDLTLADWDRVLRVNLTGVFLCLKYQVPPMLKAGGGSIVNLASSVVMHGFATIAEYTASKAGVLGLTRAAALDYAAQNVRVNAILPGPVNSPMLRGSFAGQDGMEETVANAVPVKRLGAPAELGEAIIWLLSGEASFVTGASINVDGGITL